MEEKKNLLKNNMKQFTKDICYDYLSLKYLEYIIGHIILIISLNMLEEFNISDFINGVAPLFAIAYSSLSILIGIALIYYYIQGDRSIKNNRFSIKSIEFILNIANVYLELMKSGLLIILLYFIYHFEIKKIFYIFIILFISTFIQSMIKVDKNYKI